MPRNLSRHLRRNGGAIVSYATELDWTPDCIVQVGVGCVHREIEILQEAFPQARWVGFEPCKRTYDGLKKTYPGALYQMAIGKENGLATLYRKPNHRDGSSLKQVDGIPEMVDVRTLDSVHDEYGPFGRRLLLWLDCEGSELDVLNHGRTTLASAEMVNAELLTRTDKRAPDWCHADDVHSFLNNSKFVRCATHTHRSCIGQADCLYVHRSLLDERDAWWCAGCACQRGLK